MSVVSSVKGLFGGKKTYLLCLVAVVYGVAGYYSGHLGGKEAMDVVWMALAGSALRAGVSKK